MTNHKYELLIQKAKCFFEKFKPYMSVDKKIDADLTKPQYQI